MTFQFKSSKRSNNGTDVGSGQIPEILYRIPEIEKETGVPIQLLDKQFSSSVSPVSGKIVKSGLAVTCFIQNSLSLSLSHSFLPLPLSTPLPLSPAWPQSSTISTRVVLVSAHPDTPHSTHPRHSTQCLHCQVNCRNNQDLHPADLSQEREHIQPGFGLDRDG